MKKVETMAITGKSGVATPQHNYKNETLSRGITRYLFLLYMSVIM